MPRKCQYRETPTIKPSITEIPGSAIPEPVQPIINRPWTPEEVSKLEEIDRKATVKINRFKKPTEAELARTRKSGEELRARLRMHEEEKIKKEKEEIRKEVEREHKRISQIAMEQERRRLTAKTPLEEVFFADMEKYLGEAEAEKQDNQREQYLVLKNRKDAGEQLTSKENELFDHLRDWADVYLMRLGALRDLKDQEKKIDRLEAEKPKGVGGFFKKLVRPLTMTSEYNKLAQLRDTYLDHLGAREVAVTVAEVPKPVGMGRRKREAVRVRAGEKKKVQVVRKEEVSEEQPPEVIELAERLEAITKDSKDLTESLENGRLTLNEAEEKISEMKRELGELGSGKVRLDTPFLEAYRAFAQAEEYLGQMQATRAKKQPHAKKEKEVAA